MVNPTRPRLSPAIRSPAERALKAAWLRSLPIPVGAETLGCDRASGCRANDPFGEPESLDVLNFDVVLPTPRRAPANAAEQARPRRLDHLPDVALIRLAQSGDPGAIALVLQRNRTHIERICRRLCRNDDSFDDVRQETYLGIIRNIRTFRQDSSFLTWVYTIARTFRGRHLRTLNRNLERKRRFEQYCSDREGEHESVDPERHLAGCELGRQITVALRLLSEVDREVLLLRDAEGRSAAEVAERVGLTISAVKTRLHRARVLIRGELAPARQ